MNLRNVVSTVVTNCKILYLVGFQKFLFDEMDFNRREGGMLDDENAGRNDRL